MSKVVIAVVLSARAAMLSADLDTVAHAQGGLVAPGNVSAQNAGNPGEVRISWHEVPGAVCCRIGWAVYEDHLATALSEGDWLEAFAFADVANRGQTTHTIPRPEEERYAVVVAPNDSRYGTPLWPPQRELQLVHPGEDVAQPGVVEVGAPVMQELPAAGEAIMLTQQSSDRGAGRSCQRGHHREDHRNNRACTNQAGDVHGDSRIAHGRVLGNWRDGVERIAAFR